LSNITLVMHDWGSALGFHYAMRHENNIKGVAFMCGFRRKLPLIPEITLPLIPSSNSLVDSNTKVAGLRQLFV